MDRLAQDFERCVTLSRDKWFNYVYKCKLGMWSVSGSTSPKAKRHAMHYFRQYYADGEYNNLLRDQAGKL